MAAFAAVPRRQTPGSAIMDRLMGRTSAPQGTQAMARRPAPRRIGRRRGFGGLGRRGGGFGGLIDMLRSRTGGGGGIDYAGGPGPAMYPSIEQQQAELAKRAASRAAYDARRAGGPPDEAKVPVERPLGGFRSPAVAPYQSAGLGALMRMMRGRRRGRERGLRGRGGFGQFGGSAIDPATGDWGPGGNTIPMTSEQWAEYNAGRPERDAAIRAARDASGADAGIIRRQVQPVGTEAQAQLPTPIQPTQNTINPSTGQPWAPATFPGQQPAASVAGPAEVNAWQDQRSRAAAAYDGPRGGPAGRAPFGSFGGGAQRNPFAANPQMIQRMMQMLQQPMGGGFGRGQHQIQPYRPPPVNNFTF